MLICYCQKTKRRVFRSGHLEYKDTILYLARAAHYFSC
nr:MAG TPA: hypothetical protein [Caudoviricetes sp.]